MKLTIALLGAALAAASPARAEVLRGLVAETIDAGDYTYIRVAGAQGDRWAAVSRTSLKKGAAVAVVSDAVLEKFRSPTLGRTFDRIVFGALESARRPDPHAGLAAARAQAPARVEPVAKATGPDGRTVAEVRAQRTALKGKTVLVSGRVVKYNAGIMGANWLHLRDGSGGPDGKDDDLTVTTEQEASVGETVTVRGTVAVDKDLGSGYFFPVLLENARLARP